MRIREFKQQHSETVYKYFFPKWQGNNKNINCFAHDDEKPSLSIYRKDGEYRHHCHACGISGDCLNIIAQKENITDIGHQIGRLKEIAGITEPMRKIVKTYDYVDDSGNLLFQTVKYEPKDFNQRRPDGKGSWIYNLKDICLVPYNLPKVLKAKGVIIVEGEKDVDNLDAIGFTATCNPMGAGKWRPEYNQYFKDKRVAIIPDNDKPGRDHTLSIAKNLKGIAESVKVVELSDLPEKGDDVSNWIAQGHTKEELIELIKQTSEWEEPEEDTLSFLRKGSDLLNLECNIEWIVDKLIPKQSITLLHGKGGIGKTWLSLIIADAVSKGISFMGIETQAMPVIFVDFENSLPVLVERVKKIKASEVLFWHNTNEIRPPKLDREEWIQYKNLPVGLLIYDTLRASQSKDENSSQDMAFIMARLKELRDMGFTILMLHHTPKSNDRTYKGSTAIMDLADHVLSLHKVRKGSLEDTDDDEEEGYYRFGTKEKTRYEPFHIFLDFDPEKGFVLAPDPDLEDMRELHNIIVELKDSKGELPIQSQILDTAKEELNFGNIKTRKLLKKGEGKYWNSTHVPERRNAKIFEPIQFDSLIGIYRGNKLTNSPSQFDNGDSKINAQSLDNTKFDSLSEDTKQTNKQEVIDLEHEEIEIIE